MKQLILKAMTGLTAVKITAKHHKTGKVYQKTVYRRGAQKEKLVPKSAYGDHTFSNERIARVSFQSMNKPYNYTLLKTPEGKFMTTTNKRAGQFKKQGYKEVSVSPSEKMKTGERLGLGFKKQVGLI